MLRIVSFLIANFVATSAYANICTPDEGNLLRVVNVQSNDTLNVRSGWTTNYDVLFELNPDQIGISYNDVAYKSDECLSLCRKYLRGQGNLHDTIERNCRNKSRIWYKIALRNGATGWASGKYLSEYQKKKTSTPISEQTALNDSPSREDEAPSIDVERLAQEADESRAEEKRLAQEAEEKRRAEKERLAKEAEESRAEEKRLAQEAEEKRRAEKERLAKEAEEKRLKAVEANFGFRDIKPGMKAEEVYKSEANCNLATGLNFNRATNCYGIDNIKFITDAFKQTSIINTLGLDMGVLNPYGWASYIFADTDPETGNIYASMRKNLDQYTLEYEFTERDLDFFNNGERNVLRVVYEQGQIVLTIQRVKVDDWNDDIRLRLFYREPTIGELYYTKHKPQKASASDF